jgi:hypothetical protein
LKRAARLSPRATRRSTQRATRWACIEGPHLEGHAPKNSLQAFLLSRDVTADRAVAEWVVRAPQGIKLALSARADRAGAVKAEVVLD